MHPCYRDSKNKSRPILIGSTYYARSLQGGCVYSGRVYIKSILDYDKLKVDLLDFNCDLGRTVFDPTNCIIQNKYTHNLYKLKEKGDE